MLEKKVINEELKLNESDDESNDESDDECHESDKYDKENNLD